MQITAAPVRGPEAQHGNRAKHKDKNAEHLPINHRTTPHLPLKQVFCCSYNEILLITRTDYVVTLNMPDFCAVGASIITPCRAATSTSRNSCGLAWMRCMLAPIKSALVRMAPSRSASCSTAWRQLAERK